MIGAWALSLANRFDAKYDSNKESKIYPNCLFWSVGWIVKLFIIEVNLKWDFNHISHLIP